MNASDKGAVVADPYSYDAASIEEPPQSLRGMLRRIGPGLLLTAAIV